MKRLTMSVGRATDESQGGVVRSVEPQLTRCWCPKLKPAHVGMCER
jgi:hypothetical protein